MCTYVFNTMNGANMEEIVKMAQQVASNIAKNQTEPIDPQNMDMGKVISQVTDSVSKMITPDMLEKISGGVNINSENTINNSNIKSKINLDETAKSSKSSKSSKNKSDKSSNSKKVSSVMELDELEESDTECNPIAPRTKDLHFTLNVTLDELYSGKTKKLAVRRKRLITDGKKKTLTEEKKKISVNIEPGMFDEQVITFNKQADEKEGYETGDIIITLCCAEHDEYDREGNNLLIEKEISIYEAYKCEMTLTHLNGTEININSTPINIFGDELDCYRKLKGFGMPIYGSDNEYGDLIIKFKSVIPDDLTTEQLDTLKKIFPKINEKKQLCTEQEYDLELATESDFEYSDDDSDSEYTDDSDEEDDEDDEEEDNSEVEVEDNSEENTK